MAAPKKRAPAKAARAQDPAPGKTWKPGAGKAWSEASGPAAHVKPSHQDEAHAPRRKTLDLGFPSWCLGDVCAADVKEYLRHSDTILIPKASLEQHGAHLPLFCDSITADEVARRAGRKAGILYTPTLWMGYSPQHLKAPGEGTGTITLRVDTYLNLLYDIGRSLIHHGFRRLVFVNGHGSNVKVVAKCSPRPALLSLTTGRTPSATSACSRTCSRDRSRRRRAGMRASSRPRSACATTPAWCAWSAR